MIVAVAVSIPVCMLALALRVATRGYLENTRITSPASATRYALEIAAHLAHNSFHLLAERGVLLTSVASLSGFTPEDESPGLASSSTVLVLRLRCTLRSRRLGYAIHRITNRR